MSSAERAGHSVGGAGIAVLCRITVRRYAGAGSCGRGYGHAGGCMRSGTKMPSGSCGTSRRQRFRWGPEKEYTPSVPQIAEKASTFYEEDRLWFLQEVQSRCSSWAMPRESRCIVPYMLNNTGQTVFEAYRNNQLALEGGKRPMSQRREKQFRELERRGAALENLAMPTIAEWSNRAIAAESKLAGMAMDAEWAPAKPKRGLLRRIVNFFRRR